MRRITRIALASSTLLLLAACAKKETPAKDTVAAMAPAAPAPKPTPTLALADVAGKWQFASVPMAGKDTSPTTYELTATADTTGWSMTFDKSKLTVPLQVSVEGDSVRLASPEFASQRRKATKVKIETTLHLKDGKLAGPTTAHYVTTGADSVVQMRSEGTRKP